MTGKVCVRLFDPFPPIVIDRFDESDASILKLYCTILVERDSQKGIVVGKGGEMNKQIGTAARLGLEAHFETRVFLDLHVKVKSDWRDDDRVLHDIGVGGGRGSDDG